MTSSTLALKRPLDWHTGTALLVRLWLRYTRHRPPAAASLGELGNHLLRDIQGPDRVHGQALEHSELARYDRQQARHAAHLKI